MSVKNKIKLNSKNKFIKGFGYELSNYSKGDHPPKESEWVKRLHQLNNKLIRDRYTILPD